MLSLPTLQTHREGQDLKGEPVGHPAEGGGERVHTAQASRLALHSPVKDTKDHHSSNGGILLTAIMYSGGGSHSDSGD